MSAAAPKHATRVALIGYRGSGKSAVGAALARRLNWEHVDTDAMIESALGKSIAEIFRIEGEPRFRELEAAAVWQAVHMPRRVISVGGGALLSQESRTLLSREALCVWLRAEPATLRDRLSRDERTPSSRPPLTDAGDALREIETLLAARSPTYTAAAAITIPTDALSVEQVVERILTAIAQRQPA